MIRMLISIALNRDLQGDPVYIRCVLCGTTASSLDGALLRARHHPARVDLSLLRPIRIARSRRAARRTHQRLGPRWRLRPLAPPDSPTQVSLSMSLPDPPTVSPSLQVGIRLRAGDRDVAAAQL